VGRGGPPALPVPAHKSRGFMTQFTFAQKYQEWVLSDHASQILRTVIREYPFLIFLVISKIGQKHIK